MKLLRSQKRAIAAVMDQKGFSPADFHWEEVGPDEKLLYRDTRYYFLFGGDHIMFCPARKEIEINIRLTTASGSFAVCSRWVAEWLDCLRQELDAPDWEQLSSHPDR